MIIKSMSRKSGSFGGLMNYMFEKPELAKQQLLYQTRNGQLQPFTVKHLLKGQEMEDWIREFEQNQQNRKFTRKDMVLFYHEIISLSPKDTALVNDDMLNDISRQYIRMRSPYAPAVATIHKDADHMHVHFCIAGCQYKTGLANRLSKSDFMKVKQEMEAYQQEKYPELIHSVVEHGKGLQHESEQENQLSIRTQKRSKKAEIKAQIQAILTQAQTFDELLEALESANMPTYMRGGSVYGVTVDGRNYRFSTLGLSPQIETLNEQQNLLDEIDTIRQNHQERTVEIEHFHSFENPYETDEQPEENSFPTDDFDLDNDTDEDC